MNRQGEIMGLLEENCRLGSKQTHGYIFTYEYSSPLSLLTYLALPIPTQFFSPPLTNALILHRTKLPFPGTMKPFAYSVGHPVGLLLARTRFFLLTLLENERWTYV